MRSDGSLTLLLSSVFLSCFIVCVGIQVVSWSSAGLEEWIKIAWAMC